jgi:hypothetical protein
MSTHSKSRQQSYEFSKTTSASLPLHPKIAYLLMGDHRHMVRGGHGLPKFSPGPAIRDPSTTCEWATPENAL